jgi:hypothetical protein
MQQNLSFVKRAPHAQPTRPPPHQWQLSMVACLLPRGRNDLTPTKPTTKSDLVKMSLYFAGGWFALTTIGYFVALNPDYPAYSESIPFLVFYGRSTLWLCAIVGAMVTVVYLAKLYKKRQRAMQKELENERRAGFQVTPLRKTSRRLKATLFIGVMPILVTCVSYRLLVYLDRFDTSSPLFKIPVQLFLLGLIYFSSFVLGMGLTGRSVDLSDQGFVAQFFGRIAVFILNALILGILFFWVRSCRP